MVKLTATLSLEGGLVNEFAPGVYIWDSEDGPVVLSQGAIALATEGGGLGFQPASGEFEVPEAVIRVAKKYELPSHKSAE